MKPLISSERQPPLDSHSAVAPESHAASARRKREEAEKRWNQGISSTSTDDLPLLIEPTGDSGGDLPDIEPSPWDRRTSAKSQ